MARPLEAGQAAGRELLLRLLRPRPPAPPDAAGTAGGAAAATNREDGEAAATASPGPSEGWSGLMWRSAKRDVESELGLPPQSAHVARLRLNAVELHFYNRQHQVRC